MEKLKTYGLALALCGSLVQMAAADTLLSFSIDKRHYFTGTVTSRFDGGDLSVIMRDGTFVFQYCYGTTSFPFPVPSDPVLCPLGSTGFVAAGDLNGDGVQDDLTYWSIVSPVAAVIIEPFRPDMVKLIGRPSRELPLLENFKDISTIIYWNLQDPTTFAQYNISMYSIERDYAAATDDTAASGLGALLQMNRELVSGQYIFEFPALKRDANDPDQKITVGITLTPNIEALDLTARYRTGFYFTNGNWDPQYFSQIDPRKATKISWTGNSRDLIRAGDSFYFAILNADGATVEYPSPYYPDNFLKLTTTTQTVYTMPPLFFKVGDEKELSLQYRRQYGTNTSIFDFSLRDFRAKLRMVDSYAGFSSLYFPQGTAAARSKSTADYDGDGINNITEFASEWPTTEQVAHEAFEENVLPNFDFDLFGNPILSRKVTALVFPNNNPNENLHPVAVKASAKPLEVRSYIDADGFIVCDVVKRPFSGTTLKVTFEQQVPSNLSVPRYKKITLGKDWRLDDQVFDEATEQSITAMVSEQDLTTGQVFPAAPRTFTISLGKQYWRLKSTAPAADPTATPNFRVTVTEAALK